MWESSSKVSELLSNLKKKYSDGRAPRKLKISNYVDIHDPHNLEINTNFDIYKGPIEGVMEVHLFFPKVFGLSDCNSADLLGDLQTRMRLSGRLQTKYLKGNIHDLLNRLSQDLASEKYNRVEKKLKQLGVYFGDWLTSQKIFLSKKYSQLQDRSISQIEMEVLLAITAKSLEDTHKLLNQFSTLMQKCKTQMGQADKILMEFVLHRYINFLSHVKYITEELKKGYKSKAVSAVEVIINANVKQATEMQAQVGYDLEDNRKGLSLYLIKMSYLKKYFQSQQFVDLFDQTNRAKIAEPIAMIAAGIAGFIAATAAILSGGLASDVGSHAYNLIIMLTLVYIFRDRLKEISKVYLIKRMSRLLPDTKIRLRYKTKTIGLLKTWIEVNSSKNFTSAIKDIRKAISLFDIDKYIPHDRLYIKRVFQLQTRSKDRKKDHRQLIDVCRLNIHRYLKNLDKAEKRLGWINSEGKLEHRKVARVYPAYLIIRTFVQSKDSHQNIEPLESTKAFRVFLNKQGIQELELAHKEKASAAIEASKQ